MIKVGDFKNWTDEELIKYTSDNFDFILTKDCVLFYALKEWYGYDGTYGYYYVLYNKNTDKFHAYGFLEYDLGTGPIDDILITDFNDILIATGISKAQFYLFKATLND